MSKRSLRSSKKDTQNNPDIITVSDSEIISINDGSESDCSIVVFEKSEGSNDVIEYISSDDEEPKKKKQRPSKKIRDMIKLQNKSRSSDTLTIVDTRETSSTSEDQSLLNTEQSTSSQHIQQEPPKKKRKLNPKDTEKKSKKTISSKAKNKSETKISIKSSTSNNNLKFAWADEDLLAEKEKLQKDVARSLVKLFDDGNTIPFISRYRRHLTGDMAPDKVRFMRESYEEIIELKTKSKSVFNSLEKSGQLTSDIEKSILNCKSLEELEYLYAPFKPASKKSLVERAKALDLEEPAIAILNATNDIDIHTLVKENGPEGLRTKEEVEKNLVHIIGHKIAHNMDVLEFVRDLKKTLHVQITTKMSISAKAKNNIKYNEDIPKFQMYFDRKFDVRSIQPHQVLAINRAETLKILSVKVVIPDYAFHKFKRFCSQKWLNNNTNSRNRIHLFEEAVQEIYNKSITPLISRKIRAELKQTAHKTSIEVFADNCRQLLLEPPVKGKVIMGIDPGLKQGCKVAVISSTGNVLDTCVIYPFFGKRDDSYSALIRDLLIKHNCSLIAIGNGTACRETENWLTNLIGQYYFDPLRVSYTIVDESGASVYSCSPEAKKEFPNLDPLQISAISLARRVQDPLAELVKVDPKSLGIGMYQHDINHKLLDNTLNEVVSACVSFVGVDLNTASHCLLRRVAGLTAQRASSIISYREENGPFSNRYQLKDVKHIGQKSFEQCVGFLRIMPTKQEAAKFYERPDTTPLDCTDIHPETYEIVDNILETLGEGLLYKEIGSPNFINKFKDKIRGFSVENLAAKYNSTEQTINLIIDVLSKPLAYDLRSKNTHGPIFKKNITRFADLTRGCIVTGRVTNVVVFGAFVDIGVGKSGLIHTKNMNGKKLKVTNQVEVKVIDIQYTGRQLIDLELINILR